MQLFTGQIQNSDKYLLQFLAICKSSNATKYCCNGIVRVETEQPPEEF